MAESIIGPTGTTLLIPGSESWTGDWEKDGRTDAFKCAEIATIQKASHWVHRYLLGEFLGVVKRFLAISAA